MKGMCDEWERCELLEELKRLLIEELNLEDISIGDIDVNAPLFGAGLGLDSIDALELAIVIERSYGVKIKSGDENNEHIFSSLSALAAHIEANRSK